MKIICVGRNYVEHIEELNNEKPKEPIIFFKPTVSLNKSSDFSLPEFSNDIHHEIEIIFEIGSWRWFTQTSKCKNLYDSCNETMALSSPTFTLPSNGFRICILANGLPTKQSKSRVQKL